MGLTELHQSWSGARKRARLQLFASTNSSDFKPDIFQIFSTLNIWDESCSQRGTAAIESTRHVLRANPWGKGCQRRRSSSTFDMQHCCCYSDTHKYSIHGNTGHSAMQKHCNMSTQVPSTAVGVCVLSVEAVYYLENISSRLASLAASCQAKGR